MRIGLDIGSTTLKAVVLNERQEIVFARYRRHLSKTVDAALELLQTIRRQYPEMEQAHVAVSGSAGMGLAEPCGIPFVQEVVATRLCVRRNVPDADVAIELGGEDAKILFLSGMPDARMNGSCAGGTGAFIDQMATLLGCTLEQLNERAKSYGHLYTIASRCGVFAKSDIQPLLNQGANESDIAASILRAVVNQTIAGLAQGRPIQGKVLYLGGPLTFLSELRRGFDEALGVQGLCPDHSLYYAACGAAYGAAETRSLQGLVQALQGLGKRKTFTGMEPLFKDEAEYRAFARRHAAHRVARSAVRPGDPSQQVFLGIDAGSTTVKCALVDGDGALLDTLYASNHANPVPVIRGYLLSLYERFPGLRIRRSAATGYGEKLVQHAFGLDEGIVETVAHCKAAQALDPRASFVLDIGGQDIKCLRIRSGVIDNIYLNEACSSGCGSFLQTFAQALGEDIEAFAKKGLFADQPVDLGSRCTVFMNSSVKQAQKDGASLENISAGLSVSVVKNALYKVIRPSGADELGSHIVVQGGTFWNDAVLRAFEKELRTEVIRPDIAGLMGAYGAARYAAEQYHAQPAASTLLDRAALEAFEYETASTQCQGCANHCRLTVNRFSGNRRYVSGNRCDRPVTGKAPRELGNAYAEKRARLLGLPRIPGKRGAIGLPLGLNLYELLPFWHAFFTRLSLEVVTSPVSDRALYLSGQGTIPSDTVCFPAKLMHGHVQALLDQGVRTIFYPCMSYNLDDGLSDNCYNCPIVAYYPEVLQANMPQLEGACFLKPYVGLHQRRHVGSRLLEALRGRYPDLTHREVQAALNAGYAAYEAHMQKTREEGERIIREARRAGRPILVLAGRPYHMDPEVNHGMDRLIGTLGAAVIGEDALSGRMKGRMPALGVLNQWTYHGRLYAAAQAASTQPDMFFVQLVSFGCGCDAITGDECRRILEERGRIYTQIKIDEIENLGAATLRLRSLLATVPRGGKEVRACGS